MLAATSPATRADTANNLLLELPSQASRCESALNEAMTEGARCLVGNGLNLLMDEGMHLARGYGEKALGPRFQIMGNPAFSPVSGTIRLTGDLDVVIPFSGRGTSSVQAPSGAALFLQQGISHWPDASGSLRSNLRTGLVYRFRLSGRPYGDILGFSLLNVQDPKRGHEVLASGIDYSGRWGNGSFRYFRPTTGWRPNRPGHEERALAGMEFVTRFDITTTLRLNAAGYRWESGSGSGAWTGGARLEIGWRPHPWLRLASEYDRTGEGKETWSFRAGFGMPLGSRSSSPRWRGLGVAVSGSAPADSELWRLAEGIGRIRVATRTDVPGTVGDARIRFIGDTVASGDSVQLEIVLASAAPEDIRMEVRLVPGGGSNPAVPGVDFIDTPVVTIIPKGATRTTVTFQLLMNEGIEEYRSLSATATTAS